jgi:type IV secretory pathway VirB6-like protein
MPEEREEKGRGLASTMAKKALAPIVASAATAGTAYLIRKATEVWEEKLLPKVQEKGGGRAVARETLENAAGKVGGPASEKLSALAEKLGDENAGPRSHPQAGPSSSSQASRERERKQREQRRQQRRKTLDQAGSS